MLVFVIIIQMIESKTMLMCIYICVYVYVVADRYRVFRILLSGKVCINKMAAAKVRGDIGGQDAPAVGPDMIPLKLCLTYDPPQIGLVYKKSKNDPKKHIYVIQLNSLIFLGQPERITQLLYEKHSDYLVPEKINPEQVFSI